MQVWILRNHLLTADQLQTAAERGESGEAAHLMEAVQQLSAHFQGYASIPKVAELSGRVQALQMSLQVNICAKLPEKAVVPFVASSRKLQDYSCNASKVRVLV